MTILTAFRISDQWNNAELTDIKYVTCKLNSVTQFFTTELTKRPRPWYHSEVATINVLSICCTETVNKFYG